MSFTFRITRGFDEPFYTGSAAQISTAAVRKYDVAIDGIGYMLDLNNASTGPYKFESLPLLHSLFLQDRGTVPIGEHSLNPEDYWRRSVDDWSAGAGQIPLDHSTSIGNQYRISKGIDPWTLGQFTLLPDTAQKGQSSAATNQLIVVAGGYLYYLVGNALKYTQDLSAFTTVTGTTLSSAVDMTSDGYTTWVIDANRTYYTTRGNATYAAYHTVDHVASLIRVAKGRLFTAHGNILYTHSGSAGSATATAYFTHPNSDWQWTAIAAGNDVIYFAGYSGDKSYIYSATIKSDGTALDVPIQVAALPIGEVVRSMQAYFTLLIVGTDLGWRAFTISDSSGALIIGELVKMASPPKCFDAQDRFVWFGWTNYDSTSTGLGRIDLSTINNTIPAHASDIMAAGQQGTVTSVVFFLGKHVFCVNGFGIFSEITNKVSSGTLNSGWLNFNLADSKLAIKFNLQNRAGQGTIALAIATDDQSATTIGNPIVTSASTGSSATIQLPQLQGRNFETVFTLTRGSDNTQAPVVRRQTLMVEPQPERRAKFFAPLMIHGSVTNRVNQKQSYDPPLERRRFFNLMQSRQIVPFQDVEQSYQVIVDDIHWMPYEQVFEGVERGWHGTLLVELKVIN